LLLGVWQIHVSMWEPNGADGRGGRADLEPLADVLLLAILEEALVVRDVIHAGDVEGGGAAWLISICS
jgi:hypothetical protein